MEKKISLIVPMYNAEKYLEDCIDSLRHQTLSEIEILLIDDGSSDHTLQISQSYALQDERIRVFCQKNAGQGMARNRGLEAAGGKYVLFVDADDYIRSDMCERMYQAAIKYNADMVLAGICQVGGSLFSGEGSEEICCFDREEIFFGEAGRKRLAFGTIGAEAWEEQDSRYNFSACKNLYRRALIEKNKLRFLSEKKVISEDVLFLLDVVSCVEQAVGIPGAFYCYRRHEVSYSRKYREDLFDQYLKLAKLVTDRAGYLTKPELDRCLGRMLQAKARVALVSEIQHGRAGGKDYVSIRPSMARICANQTLQQILHRYPYWKLPKKQALFAFTMRYRLFLLQYLLVCLRERG